MYSIIKPFFTLANDNLLALSRILLPSEQVSPNPASLFWRACMENQARFVRDYTQGVLGVLEHNRTLTSGHFDEMSERTERVASQLTHSAVRAVGIATHARHEKRDRRVFPLPLPSERRGETRIDRRQGHLGIVRHAVN